MDAGSRPPPPAVISFKTYHRLEDAWRGGLEAWCRAATAHVISGGAAWLVAVSDAHANAIKHRLLQEGISVAGVRFLHARALRGELCLRLGIEPPVFGRETLELLLRLRLGDAQGVLGPALEALEDFDAAGWAAAEDLPGCSERLPILQSSGSWTPDVDRRIAGASSAGLPPLRLCIVGWDAGFWPQFGLLRAAMRCAEEGRLFLPLPRGAAEELQQSWLAGIEEAAGVPALVCENAGAAPAQAALASRLEGVDLEQEVPEPAWLVGAQWSDAVPLAADFVARWLVAHEGNASRMAIVAPGQSPAALALRRALDGAGIAVADEIGDISEPSLDAQVVATLANFHREGGTVEHLLALVELLNERGGGAAPIDPMALRQSLDRAFWEVQERSAWALCGSRAFARTAVAGPVRPLMDQLAPWPASLRWDEAMTRWEICLAGFGISAEALEPSWSRWKELPGECAISASRFFEQVNLVLAAARARGRASTAKRFARVVLTTLEGASGRFWGGALFLDAVEGVWPVYPAQNPFLNDAARSRLNALRQQAQAHLLTAADRAQLDQWHFLEILENCDGPLAFAGAARDALDPSQALYPNEFALRCLMETMPPDAGDRLLDRWGNAARRAPRAMPPLASAEAAHLRRVHRRRRDPLAPFDDYHFNFEALTSPDDLPWGGPWCLRDVKSAWERPASFALSHILDARPARGGQTFQRMENQAVGALVHRWLKQALRPPRDAAAAPPDAWRGAFLRRLGEAVRESAKALGEASPWHSGAIAKAQWAAASCLEAIAAGELPTPCFLARPLIETNIRTPAGGLRVRVSGDLMLLDRPELPGAVCWLIDVTGNEPATKVTSPAHWTNGSSLDLKRSGLRASPPGREEMRCGWRSRTREMHLRSR